MYEITFLTHNDTWYLCQATKVYNLIVHDLDHVERIPRGDGVYEDVAVNTDGVLRVERGVLVLDSDRHTSRKRVREGKKHLPAQQCQ